MFLFLLGELRTELWVLSAAISGVDKCLVPPRHESLFKAKISEFPVIF